MATAAMNTATVNDLTLKRHIGHEVRLKGEYATIAERSVLVRVAMRCESCAVDLVSVPTIRIGE